ncbi:hypothetical protein [Ornithinibacillus scapharcae]|nr:hypothetical protein [Ornithinibacillus scapharcae]
MKSRNADAAKDELEENLTINEIVQQFSKQLKAVLLEELFVE